jgi:uncharacterized protein (TIGR00296 family)
MEISRNSRSSSNIRCVREIDTNKGASNLLPFQLDQNEGEFLVKHARKAVEEYLKTGGRIRTTETSESLQNPCGVFVTINSVKDGKKQLRGCIGHPYPTAPLIQAVIESAISASTQDPRFNRVSIHELDNVVFEVSIMTPPQKLEVKNPMEYLTRIKIGIHGLIVERGMSKGLLLPQVAVEWNWDEEEFLCQCCGKAGLPPDCWLMSGTNIHKFDCIIAQELTPNGPVRIVGPDLREYLDEETSSSV